MQRTPLRTLFAVDGGPERGYRVQMKWMYVLFALTAGMLIPLQAGINMRIRADLGGPMLATFVSFAVGTGCLAFYLALSRTDIPTQAMIAGAPWWAWTGGALGVVIVFSTIVLGASLGAAAAFAWLLTGQFIAALVLDHFGLVSFAVREISPTRILGVVLLIAGAMLVNR